MMPRSTRFVSGCLSGLHAARFGLVAASLSVLLMACGAAAVPPQELVDARAAFAEAAKGPAADLAPAQLDTAKQSLDGAQRSFDEDGASQTTKDLAYVAQRRAEIAAAEGGREKAERKRAAADKDLKNTQAQGLENYAKTKEALAAEKTARVEGGTQGGDRPGQLGGDRQGQGRVARRRDHALGLGALCNGQERSLADREREAESGRQSAHRPGLQSHRRSGLHGLGRQRDRQRGALDAASTIGA